MTNNNMMVDFAMVNRFLLLFLILFVGVQSLFNNLINTITGMPSIGRFRGLSSLTMAGKIKVEDVLKAPDWPPKWPYAPSDFVRQDESVDSNFYANERLVYHIDDYAVDALTKYYKKNIKDGSNVLDICSSWVSHYPSDSKYNKVAGLGMNKYELEQNKQLTEFTVKDLNQDPIFPYSDNTFDYVTCVVSIDYLNKPLQVVSEINRVLKPGGKAIISQSNRCFPTKAIKIWLETNDLQHIFIIGSYFHYAGKFKPAEAEDISPNPGRSDPMYIITAEKE